MGSSAHRPEAGASCWAIRDCGQLAGVARAEDLNLVQAADTDIGKLAMRMRTVFNLVCDQAGTERLQQREWRSRIEHLGPAVLQREPERYRAIDAGPATLPL